VWSSSLETQDHLSLPSAALPASGSKGFTENPRISAKGSPAKTKLTPRVLRAQGEVKEKEFKKSEELQEFKEEADSFSELLGLLELLELLPCLARN
jgi:hypothetical protein